MKMLTSMEKVEEKYNKVKKLRNIRKTRICETSSKSESFQIWNSIEIIMELGRLIKWLGLLQLSEWTLPKDTMKGKKGKCIKQTNGIILTTVFRISN